MDAVYVCRSGDNEELRYSIRSLVNLDHDRVWVFGDGPDWLTSACRVPVSQGGDRQANAHSALVAACHHPEVSDPFIFMNDDFFILRPVELKRYHLGPLADFIEVQRRDYPHGIWAKRMPALLGLLRSAGFDDPLCFEGHTPVVFEKDKLLACLMHPPGTQYRTLYGNLFSDDAVPGANAKVRADKTPDLTTRTFLSTSDKGFANVHAALDSLFPEPSEYEEPPMKVRAVRRFRDKKAQVQREAGDEFIVSKERFAEINSSRHGRLVEAVEKR